MKYCTHCGKQLLDEAVLCIGCGCDVRRVRGVATPQATKFCNYCGAEVLKDAVVCPKCGCPLAGRTGNALQIVTKVLMVLTGVIVLLSAITMLVLALVDANLAKICVDDASYDFYELLSRIFVSLFVLLSLSLAWIIPMTVHYFKAIKRNQPVGTAFKVCTLIFVNLVAGILLLSVAGNNKKYTPQPKSESSIS